MWFMNQTGSCSGPYTTIAPGSWISFLLLTCGWSPNQFHLLPPSTQSMVNAVAPHSSTLAWKIPWMEEPGRLQSVGSLGVGPDWATSLSFFAFMHRRRTWQPTPVFLPGESQGRGSLVGCRLWVAQSQTWLKWLRSSSTASKKLKAGIYPAVQWLKTSCCQCRGLDSIPGCGTKIPYAKDEAKSSKTDKQNTPPKSQCLKK